MLYRSIDFFIRLLYLNFKWGRHVNDVVTGNALNLIILLTFNLILFDAQLLIVKNRQSYKKGIIVTPKVTKRTYMYTLYNIYLYVYGLMCLGAVSKMRFR